ncbi:MAG: phosphoglycerate dehydrogenase [Planctomycetales bacterium]
MARVIILDTIAQEGLDLLEQADGIEYEVRTGLKGEDLRQALAEFDGAICRSGVKITAEVLEGNRRIKAIARAGVGTDNIDSKAAKKIGAVVMNTPAGNTLSTAEHSIAMMLALSRNIAPAHQSLVEGRWDRKKFMGAQVAGKTLGVIGLGRIGQAVAQRAIGLEMNVLGYDPFLTSARARELGIEPRETVKEMLPEVDYLTVHTPLTDETRGLIGREELDLLRPGARLINCARGGIYEEAALIEGLESGKLAGVALDVYQSEPCTDSPLFAMSGVLATPHLGASTQEAQTNVAVEAAELLIAFFQTGAVRHAVNMPPIDPQELQTLRPYLNLAYRLGLLQAQLCASGPPEKCELLFRGQIADADTRLLSASFAVGFLENALDHDVNIVNAEEALQQRGVELQRNHEHRIGDFSSMIRAKVTTDRGDAFTVGGTVFGNKMLRWVRCDQFRMDAYLDGVLLVFRHQDKPGTIGAMGTNLGGHQVNIGQMAVGREQPCGEALGVLNLDAPPPEEAIQEILEQSHIHSCQVIQLPSRGSSPDWLGG